MVASYWSMLQLLGARGVLSDDKKRRYRRHSMGSSCPKVMNRTTPMNNTVACASAALAAISIALKSMTSTKHGESPSVANRSAQTPTALNPPRQHHRSR
jgi:hypothetical protein